MKWLQDEFAYIPEGAHKNVPKQHCKAYLLRLIGGFILPDKSTNRVHLKYLPLLEKIRDVSKYSWGSACLAILYREMCRETTSSSTSMGGCTLLLQSWVWYCMSFIAPHVNRHAEWPLAKRWVGRGLNHTRTPYGNLVSYRSRIDHMRQDEFEWLSYQEIQFNLPPRAFQDRTIWSANTALVCFQNVE